MGDQILQIRAANSTEISFKGVLLLEFSVNDDSNPFTVPFLVTTHNINEPILGYNVIEHLIIQDHGKNDLLKSCFVTEICSDKIDLMISMIQERSVVPDTLGKVKVPETTVISAGCCSSVKCRVKVLMDESEQTIHFRPSISENGDDDLSFSETLSTVRRGRSQFIHVDVMNPSKTE